MIQIVEIRATNDSELEEKLNQINGRIISVQPQNDDWYKIIYEK